MYSGFGVCFFCLFVFNLNKDSLTPYHGWGSPRPKLDIHSINVQHTFLYLLLLKPRRPGTNLSCVLQDSWSTILLPRHQPIRRKLYTLQPSTQMLPIKTSPKPTGEFRGFLSMIHPFPLPGPSIKLSLLQTPMFLLIWPHCASETQTFIR